MKLAIIGYGQMGQAIHKQAEIRQHQIISTLDIGDTLNTEKIQDADMVIEVSTPQSCLDNIKKILALNTTERKNLIVVTTGWYDQLEQVKKIIQEANIRFLYSANFSIGVNVYYRIIEAAARLINKCEEYDIWGTEIHHKNKMDSPSGTAKKLEEILLNNISRKTKIVEEKLNRKIDDNEIHFSSTRGGTVNFAHTIGFDSDADCIEIKHAARNRDGYALGVIKTAEWLSKQEIGFYTMDDFLSSQLT